MTEWKPTLEQKRRLENPAPNRKLTVEQVLEIRMLQAQGRADFKRLSEQYGVDRNAIRMAALGHTFKELPMPPDQARRGARRESR